LVQQLDSVTTDLLDYCTVASYDCVCVCVCWRARARSTCVSHRREVCSIEILVNGICHFYGKVTKRFGSYLKKGMIVHLNRMCMI
jgi:hypothetical protein